MAVDFSGLRARARKPKGLRLSGSQMKTVQKQRLNTSIIQHCLTFKMYLLVSCVWLICCCVRKTVILLGFVSMTLTSNRTNRPLPAAIRLVVPEYYHPRRGRGRHPPPPPTSANTKKNKNTKKMQEFCQTKEKAQEEFLSSRPLRQLIPAEVLSSQARRSFTVIIKLNVS